MHSRSSHKAAFCACLSSHSDRVTAGNIRTWQTTVILITGKAQGPPISAPCRDQDDTGSGMSGVYLWL